MSDLVEERRLYGDAKLIEQQLAKMLLMEEAAGGWAAVYKDPATSAFWMKYYATAATQGGGYLTLLKLPAPTTEELIHIAVDTNFEDEAVAAVLRLLDEETIEKKDFRHLLVERLEGTELKGIPVEQKQRIRKIITLTSLLDPTNKREIKGRTIVQLQEDAAYFKVVSERAIKLMSKL
jgi:hypothetical protein